MSYERGIGRPDGDHGVPIEESVLSAEVAEANLAKDLAEQIGRQVLSGCTEAIVLDRQVMVGTVADAIRLFKKQQDPTRDFYVFLQSEWWSETTKYPTLTIRFQRMNP